MSYSAYPTSDSDSFAGPAPWSAHLSSHGRKRGSAVGETSLGAAHDGVEGLDAATAQARPEADRGPR